jgi:threonyl-tRNA synthetase
VGDKEVASNTVNVRTRDGKTHGTVTVDQLLITLNHAVAEKSLTV